MGSACWHSRRWRGSRVATARARPSWYRAARTRTLLVLGAGTTLVAAHLVLFSPVVSKPLCAQTVRLNSAMAHPLNCGSPVFLDLAHHPGKLLQPDNPRQSRPGAALTTVPGPVGVRQRAGPVYGTEDPAYLPLVLINLPAAVGRRARPRAVDRGALARLAVFGGLAVVPTWIAVCEAVAGSYFNNETVVYHDYVWLPDAIGAGWAELRHALATTGIDTSVDFLQVTWLPAALLAALVVAAVAGRVRPGAPSGTQARAALAGTLLTGLVTVVFLFAIGVWAYRITYTIIPTMLVAIGWVSARLSARSRPSAWAVGLALGAVVVAWVAFQLLSGGPYS